MAALHHFYDELGGTLWDIYGFRDAYKETEDWVAPMNRLGRWRADTRLEALKGRGARFCLRWVGCQV